MCTVSVDRRREIKLIDIFEKDWMYTHFEIFEDIVI